MRPPLAGTLTSLLLPSAFNLLFVWLVGPDSDGPGGPLAAAMMAAGVGGLIAAWRRPAPSLLAALALPLLAAWSRLYWKLGASSPAAAAPKLVASLTGISLPPLAAYALVLAACLLPGWLAVLAALRFKLLERGRFEDIEPE